MTIRIERGCLPSMKTERQGFTLIEVVVALVIIGVLSGMLMVGLGLTRGVLAVDAAQSALVSANNRARMVAIERGGTARLRVSASQNKAWVEFAGDTVHSIDFPSQFGVTLEALPAALTVCFNPRGYADPDCNNFGSAASVTFVAGAESTKITVLPLGQITGG